MGQKTNPNIFRLGKTKTWNLQYFEKKSTEMSIYAFKTLEIKKFIYKFFSDKGLKVHNCEIKYSNENSLHICILYYLTTTTITKINDINNLQNIKFSQKTDFIEQIENNKKMNKFLSIITDKTVFNKKKYILINKKLKNYNNYEISKIKNYIRHQKYLNKKLFTNHQKKLKLNRLNFLKIYKKYLLIKNYDNFNKITKSNFLKSFFDSLHLFINKKIKIFLTLKQLNKNTKQFFNYEKIEILKKNLVTLKKYEKNSFFKEGINTLFIGITQKNSTELIAEFLAYQLQILKKHNFFLRFIKTTLLIFFNSKMSPNLKGIKIKIKGRLNGLPRAKHKIINIGQGVPNLTIDSNISYAEKTSYTSNGTLGVKVWTYEK